MRLECRVVFALQKLPPINGVEERVRLDLGRTIGAEPLGRVPVEQLRQEISGHGRHHVFVWEVERFVQDLAIHVVDHLVVERWQASQHLVEQHPEGPPVNGLIVVLGEQQLWSEVFGCSAKCIGSILVFHLELAEAEVAESDVALVVEQNVLGLEISINNVKTVKAFQGTENLGDIEARSADIKATFVGEMVEELAPVHKREHEVQLLRRLERKLQRHNKGVVDLGEDGPLRQGMRDFGERYDLGFADDLDCVDAVGILFPYLHDLAKAASAHELQEFEVVDAQLAGLVLHNLNA